MEIPVFVVVEIVDSESGTGRLVDLPANARIHGKKPADALVSEAVDVAVVQRAVLPAAVARAKRGAPSRVKAAAGQRRGPPLRDVGLLLAEGVAGNGGEPGVVLDHRIGVGDAGAEVQAFGQHVVAAE